MASDSETNITKEIIRAILKPRKSDSHKGTYGHALLIAGAKGKMGAAVIAAKACLRSGVGLLTVDVPADERIILQTTIPEAMLSFRAADQIDFSTFTSIGIGPGMGTAKDAIELVTTILNNAKLPILLDADALNVISKDKTLFSKISDDTILTPHPKEFDRLFGDSPSVDEREKKAVKLSTEYPFVIVLKGHQTLIAYKGKSFSNTTGNAGLAKGGSGDMLTGIITALLAQKYNSLDAALAGVYLHGLAADLALKTQSMESLLATDVVENLGQVFKNTMEQ